MFWKLFKKNTDNIFVHVDVLDSLLSIYLYVNNRQCANIRCVIQSDKSIMIDDIQHLNKAKDYNKGYGSMMMERLLSYAREYKYEYVYGNFIYGRL